MESQTDFIKCMGFAGKQCPNPANAGFDYCDECFKERSKRLADNFCVAKNGMCNNKRTGTHTWCKECYYRIDYAKIHDRMQEKLDSCKRNMDAHANMCNRGGVPCTECDNNSYDYVEARRVLKGFEAKYGK